MSRKENTRLMKAVTRLEDDVARYEVGRRWLIARLTELADDWRDNENALSEARKELAATRAKLERGTK